jgi:hypothetical protein
VEYCSSDAFGLSNGGMVCSIISRSFFFIAAPGWSSMINTRSR